MNLIGHVLKLKIIKKYKLFASMPNNGTIYIFFIFRLLIIKFE